MSHQLQTIPIIRPFFTWGLDLVGPFKKAKGGFIHIFVAMYKFTKWIEVKSAASITVAKAVEFIKEIMYMFGVPNNIIIDNRTQFTAREFKDFCADSVFEETYLKVFYLVFECGDLCSEPVRRDLQVLDYPSQHIDFDLNGDSGNPLFV
jgi:hypothetical protein